MRTTIFLCFMMLFTVIGAASGHSHEVWTAVAKECNTVGPLIILIAITGDVIQFAQRIKDMIK